MQHASWVFSLECRRLDCGIFETTNNVYVTATGFEGYGEAVRQNPQGRIEGLC
jgi:hypothetical protein